MTFWKGAPLSKWRSYEVRLWAKNAPLRCIIVSKNAPKFLIKPEAPCSNSSHKPLVSRDQGGQACYDISCRLINFESNISSLAISLSHSVWNQPSPTDVTLIQTAGQTLDNWMIGTFNIWSTSITEGYHSLYEWQFFSYVLSTLPLLRILEV